MLRNELADLKIQTGILTALNRYWIPVFYIYRGYASMLFTAQQPDEAL